MEHLDFVLWMVGFPMCVAIEDCARKYRGKKKHDLQGLFDLILWIALGIALW